MSDAELVEQLSLLERVKNAAAAAQAGVAAASTPRSGRTRPGRACPPSGGDGGSPEQVALAPRESPHRGSRLLGLARLLATDLPRTFEAMTAGLVSEWRATLVAQAAVVFEPADRHRLDEGLAPRLPSLSDRQVAAEARAAAYQADPKAFVNRGQRAAADRPGERRSRSVRGRPRDDRHHAARRDRTPARLEHHGPVPAELARELLNRADPTVARGWLRRLFTDPVDGTVATIGTRRRRFDGPLRRLVVYRDQHCRTPWCGAPIRDADHVVAHSAGGPISADNGQGLCQSGNLARAAPGWAVRRGIDEGEPTSRHVVITTTPTGSTHRSVPPPALPGWRPHSHGPPAAADTSVNSRGLPGQSVEFATLSVDFHAAPNDTVDNSAESCPDPSDIVPRWGPHNHVDPEPWAEEENALTELVNELGVDELGIDELGIETLGMDERGVDLDTWTEAIAMLAKERAA